MLKSILFAVITSIVAGKGKGKSRYDYGITIDAGSRHTGLFIFRQEKRTTPHYSIRPRSNPESPDGWSMKLHPGLARFADDTDLKSGGLEKYLFPLFEFARLTLKKQDIGKIPVFFGATAGMRMVTYKKRDALMNRIRSYISTTGFKFSYRHAHVLSGEEEAMFNWVNVNNLNGFKGRDGRSIGVLDLGGASLEAAYETPYDILDGQIEVDLYGHEYRLYGRSYLQLGLTEAFRRVILETEVTSMKTNPCLPTGCLLEYSDPDNGFNKTLVGSSMQGTCSHLIQSIIQATLPCHFPTDPAGNSECHAYGQYAPDQFRNMTFYGIDGFHDFTKKLNLFQELKQHKYSTAISLPVIKKYVDVLCSNTWEDLKLRFPKTDESFLAESCFHGSFIYEVLSTGLGFPDDFENFIFAGKVDGKPLGQAPGLMVYKVDKMPVICPSCDEGIASSVQQLDQKEPQWVDDTSDVSELYVSNSQVSLNIITIVVVLLFCALACVKCEMGMVDYFIPLEKMRWYPHYTQIPQQAFHKQCHKFCKTSDKPSQTKASYSP